MLHGGPEQDTGRGQRPSRPRELVGGDAPWQAASPPSKTRRSQMAGTLTARTLGPQHVTSRWRAGLLHVPLSRMSRQCTARGCLAHVWQDCHHERRPCTSEGLEKPLVCFVLLQHSQNPQVQRSSEPRPHRRSRRKPSGREASRCLPRGPLPFTPPVWAPGPGVSRHEWQGVGAHSVRPPFQSVWESPPVVVMSWR